MAEFVFTSMVLLIITCGAVLAVFGTWWVITNALDQRRRKREKHEMELKEQVARWSRNDQPTMGMRFL